MAVRSKIEKFPFMTPDPENLSKHHFIVYICRGLNRLISRDS